LELIYSLNYLRYCNRNMFKEKAQTHKGSKAFEKQ